MSCTGKTDIDSKHTKNSKSSMPFHRTELFTICPATKLSALMWTGSINGCVQGCWPFAAATLIWSEWYTTYSVVAAFMMVVKKGHRIGLFLTLILQGFITHCIFFLCLSFKFRAAGAQ